MSRTFDEQTWLTWLVKVRIIIITFLLGIGLAIVRFTHERAGAGIRQLNSALVHRRCFLLSAELRVERF